METSGRLEVISGWGLHAKITDPARPDPVWRPFREDFGIVLSAFRSRDGRDCFPTHSRDPGVGSGRTSDRSLLHRLRGAVSPTRLVLVDQSFRRAAATA
ncbi:MAG: hypothetical protein BRD26_00970, partial [Bacteroidetes bacterium QH_1_64_81]